MGLIFVRVWDMIQASPQKEKRDFKSRPHEKKKVGRKLYVCSVDLICTEKR
jgi:hypothetical protein